jgi:hypothetical protein
MVSPNVNKALQQANSLTFEERQQFIELLRVQQSSEQNKSVEEGIAQTLLRKGIIRKIPSKLSPEDIARSDAWKPIKLEGRPVSETLIEERR